MINSQSHFISFSSITLSDPIIIGPIAKSEVTLNSTDGNTHKFVLEVRYEDDIQESNLPLLRMAFCMPLLNYGLFSRRFVLDFSLSESDIRLLDDLNVVFSRDIFVNKILRRRANYILPEFLLSENDVLPGDSDPQAEIEPENVYPDQVLARGMKEDSCGVLSSGGKESLLTYALLSEVGTDMHPLYVNESGGHWRTALPSFRYHKEADPNTQRIWTNIDRFYNFMLDHLHFIRSDHRKVKADTYPIRLCIFPFYIFALLPIFVQEGIGNLLIGSEFDDLRSPPLYHGIPHYFGIYDQHQDYDIRMNDWYSRRISGLSQWSAVRNITGLIVERILISRYPHLAEKQRSCHSCHFDDSEIVPCGTCSKCLGVLLFLMANNGDPKKMNFSEKDMVSFQERNDFSLLRLDKDERDHSFYLLEGKGESPQGRHVDHIERIHIDSDIADIRLIPRHFRKRLVAILESHTFGFCGLKEGDWIPIKKPAWL
jgi:hypothetical protein